jgi:glycosyl transferase family 2
MRGPVPIRSLTQSNRGRAAARNLGARAARGRILLFLDSDIWARPELLAAHHRHYLPHARQLGVQGRSLTHPEARSTVFMKAKEITPDLTVRRRRNLSPVHIITRNFSTLRTEFEAVGGFDESFTGYGWEDIELALRLQARGVTFDYEPDALAYHYHVETLEGLRRKLRQAGEGAVYFWQKHGRTFRLGLFLEILPWLLPLKWLVFRTPLVMPLLRWLVPRAEARGWVLVLSECYTNLLWETYYEGVFAALRRSQGALGASPSRVLTRRGHQESDDDHGDPDPPVHGHRLVQDPRRREHDEDVVQAEQRVRVTQGRSREDRDPQERRGNIQREGHERRRPQQISDEVPGSQDGRMRSQLEEELSCHPQTDRRQDQ